MIKRQLLTILTAFLFIPAFALGGTSLWTVAFALVIALFFRARLEQIIDGFMPLPEGKARAAYIAKRLPLVVLECALITAAPQIVVLWLAGHGVTLFLSGFSIGVDSAVYGMVFPWEHMTGEAKSAAVSLIIGVLSVLLTNIYAYKKSDKILNTFFYIITPPPRKNPVRFFIIYFAFQVALGAILVFAPLLPVLNNWLADPFCSMAWCMGGSLESHIVYLAIIQTLWFFALAASNALISLPHFHIKTQHNK